MAKSFQKDKSEGPNPMGPGFRTPSNIKSGFNGPKFSQSFNRRPVNVVRHKV